MCLCGTRLSIGNLISKSSLDIRVHLRENDPTEETRNKFRLRRPSTHAEYELRLGEIRVYYRVRNDVVEVLLIGEKRGDRLMIGGKEFEL